MKVAPFVDRVSCKNKTLIDFWSHFHFSESAKFLYTTEFTINPSVSIPVCNTFSLLYSVL